MSIFVRAEWDDDARAWVATSNDIGGLAIEAGTIEEIKDRVAAAVRDLIEPGGLQSDLPEIPIRIMSEQLSRVPNPRHWRIPVASFPGLPEKRLKEAGCHFAGNGRGGREAWMSVNGSESPAQVMPMAGWMGTKKTASVLPMLSVGTEKS